jgi:hypothetical protein
MTYDELIRHYGTAASAARALGYDHRQRVHKWKSGGIPLGEQALIEILSSGVLKADIPEMLRAKAA